MDTTVRAATLTDVDVVTSVLTEAFDADPMMRWAFTDDVRPRRLAAMWRYLATHGYLPAGVSTVLPGGDGAALWLPPGVTLDGAFWAEHGAAFASGMEFDMERLGAMAEQMHEHHPADDHWYLLAIGARASAQGRGVGSALLAHTLAIADEHGQPAYLEATSPRSRVLYERFGFTVLGEIQVADSPTLWAMWREPA